MQKADVKPHDTFQDCELEMEFGYHFQRTSVYEVMISSCHEHGESFVELNACSLPFMLTAVEKST